MVINNYIFVELSFDLKGYGVKIDYVHHAKLSCVSAIIIFTILEKPIVCFCAVRAGDLRLSRVSYLHGFHSRALLYDNATG